MLIALPSSRQHSYILLFKLIFFASTIRYCMQIISVLMFNNLSYANASVFVCVAVITNRDIKFAC
jgi:hypothetical protein